MATSLRGAVKLAPSGPLHTTGWEEASLGKGTQPLEVEGLLHVASKRASKCLAVMRCPAEPLG